MGNPSPFLWYSQYKKTGMVNRLIVNCQSSIATLETAVKAVKFLTNATVVMENGDTRLYLIQCLGYKDTCSTKEWRNFGGNYTLLFIVVRYVYTLNDTSV